MAAPKTDKTTQQVEAPDPLLVEAFPAPGLAALHPEADSRVWVTPAAATGSEPASQPTEAETVARPLRKAIAITYKTGAAAPRVVAKGRGAVADQIIARAQEYGVFVHESKELVSLLMQVDLDDHIPPALYRAVAELLAWLYNIEAAGRDDRRV